jgi:hypothetical protein
MPSILLDDLVRLEGAEGRASRCKQVQTASRRVEQDLCVPILSPLCLTINAAVQ